MTGGRYIVPVAEHLGEAVTPAPPGHLSDLHRRKITAWLTSMLVLTAALAAGLCMRWFQTIEWMMLAGDTEHVLVRAAGPMSEAFDPFFKAFPALLLWHLGDCLQRDVPAAPALRRWTAYSRFLAVLLPCALFMMLWASDWFLVSGNCGGIFTMLSEACAVPNPLVGLPFVLLFLALWLLAVVKLAVALRSRLGPRR